MGVSAARILIGRRGAAPCRGVARCGDVARGCGACGARYRGVPGRLGGGGSAAPAVAGGRTRGDPRGRHLEERESHRLPPGPAPTAGGWRSRCVRDGGGVPWGGRLVRPLCLGVCLLAGILNFCANNYLGLSSHPQVIRAAVQALEEFGAGLSSVRFICGTQVPGTSCL